jgi:putative ABC transport system substrate-binding protein
MYHYINTLLLADKGELNMQMIYRLLLSGFLALSLTACKQNQAEVITIGIIEPLEHRAMTEIVAGFSETLQQQLHRPFVIKVANAYNDANLQRAIIQKMRNANYSLLVPIGVSTSQMTLAMTHKQPVISLAADLDDTAKRSIGACRVAIVKDEIAMSKLLEFIHGVYPQLTRIALVHSSTDKVLPEAQMAQAEGQKLGLSVHRLMISSLPEMTAAIQALPTNIQAIFVLKDSLVVSGIATLANYAASKHIPLITSDQGSVQDGADFALGVHEKQIGIAGAELAAKVLNGTDICSLPIVKMTHLTVFVNQQALQKTGQSLTPIAAAAKRLAYTLELTNPQES